jgi:acetolactate synthase I/II/III large subunit
MTDTPRAAPVPPHAGWGSDLIAELLRALAVPYIALTPGASFRGLHDSLVNHLGNTRPELLLCVHEETAVALAHGYARVASRSPWRCMPTSG